MLSNWSHNTKMALDGSRQGSVYMVGSPLSKPLLSQNGTKLPTGKNFSTLPLGGFVGNLFQKLTTMLLRPDNSVFALERNKQSLSTPDIFFDHTINTPIFEAISGRTKLVIPEDKELTSEPTRSLSAGNSPFDWCPIDESSSKTHLRAGKTKGKQQNPGTSGSGKNNLLPARKKKHCCNTSRGLRKQTQTAKNFKQKNRQNSLKDIMDDLNQVTDSSEIDSDNDEYISSKCSPEETTLASFMKASVCIAEVSPECNSTNSSSRANSHRKLSDCESEDSFVVFSDDVQFTTPSASPRRNNICASINSFLIPAAAFTRRRSRQRQISECSDDSVVFCYDDDDQDEPTSYQQSDLDLSTDDESTDEGSSEDETADTSQQPDSGFEEKKVRFNPKPEVHVMRQWDFAYRQARKGEWEMAARDRERFRRRIDEMENILRPLFDSELRERVFAERFFS